MENQKLLLNCINSHDPVSVSQRLFCSDLKEVLNVALDKDTAAKFEKDPVSIFRNCV